MLVSEQNVRVFRPFINLKNPNPLSTMSEKRIYNNINSDSYLGFFVTVKCLNLRGFVSRKP